MYFIGHLYLQGQFLLPSLCSFLPPLYSMGRRGGGLKAVIGHVLNLLASLGEKSSLIVYSPL